MQSSASALTSATASTSTSGPPPPPRYHNSTWQLLSQGAEARVWIVPNFVTIQSKSMSAICKERFAKSYRHPQLNDSLTRARTKAEARSLVRCRRGGVTVPMVLGIDIPPPPPSASASTPASASNNDKKNCSSNGNGNGNEKQRENDDIIKSNGQMNDHDHNDDNGKCDGGDTSACLFLEHISGCTLRSFFTMDNANDDTKDDINADADDNNSNQPPPMKRAKVDSTNEASMEEEKATATTTTTSTTMLFPHNHV
mmetsp:Transcript_1407/g.1895  ORF Transcript_1407/g.1895 Transcript_1407/m.1895 type:complete len:255 (-) Transcript_1407:795-1559(-)